MSNDPTPDLLSRLSRLGAAPIVLLSVLLFVPTLFSGFFADDWIHLAFLEGAEVTPLRAPTDLFNFDSGLHPDAPAARGEFAPWWAARDFGGRFFRPLTSLTHSFDHLLWGRAAFGYHVTSLVLWALLLTGVLALYRELARDSGRGPRAVLAAGLIYAVDDAHSWNVAWLANRNALVAVLFGVGSLLAWHRWRRDSRPRHLVGSIALFALATGGGETAIGIPAYAVAWEMALGRGGLRDRVIGAAPMVGAGLVYLVGWSVLGFGVHNSALYVSPMSDPVGFLTVVLPQRLPMLFAGATTPLPAELTMMFGPLGVWIAAAAAAALGAVVIGLVWPLLKRDPMCRFAAIGGTLAMIPMVGTFTHGRVLLLSTIGISWVLGCWLVDTLDAVRRARLRGTARPRWGRLVVVSLVGAHLVLAPFVCLAGPQVLRVMGRAIEAVALEAEIDGSAGASDDWIMVLNVPDPFLPLYLYPIRHGSGMPDTAALWTVSQVPGDQKLTRTGPGSFTLEAKAPGFIATQLEGLYRDDTPFVVGEEFVRGALRVHIEEIVDGQLLKIGVSIDRELESPDVGLLAWNGERLARVPVPAVGDCTIVKWTDEGITIPLPAREQFDPAECRVDDSATALAPVCSLEVHEGGRWVKRAELPCPGEEGLGVLSVGDVGSPGATLDASVEAMKARCAVETCHLMFLAGDLVYGPGSAAEAVWRAAWDDALAEVGLPAVAVLGNHEYRHEPEPELKRVALYAADGRAGLILPAPSYAARVVRGDTVVVGIAAMDTDSISNPGPAMPGGAAEALDLACTLGVPVIAVGHHPATSQGRHHSHEAHVETAIRGLLHDRVQGGCAIVASLAGHDHDQQQYSPGCEEQGAPAIVVSGVAARGYRKAGPAHLERCATTGAESRYHAGPSDHGGFALLRVAPDGGTTATLYDVPLDGPTTVLSELSW